MRLGDLARLVRSKNAGPYMLTLDVMFRDRATLDRVVATGMFDARNIGRLYGVPAAVVTTFVLPAALTVKISFQRDVPSGALGDSDVYGCQYMARLAGALLPEATVE